MEEKHVTWEDVRQKERELTEFEDDHRLEKKNFEARYDELNTRSWELRSLVDVETDKMAQALQMFAVSPDDVADYYTEMEDLMWQSEQTYKRLLANLEDEEDEWEKNFRRKRNELEEEYNQLRRDYASTD